LPIYRDRVAARGAPVRVWSGGGGTGAQASSGRASASTPARRVTTARPTAARGASVPVLGSAPPVPAPRLRSDGRAPGGDGSGLRAAEGEEVGGKVGGGRGGSSDWCAGQWTPS